MKIGKVSYRSLLSVIAVLFFVSGCTEEEMAERDLCELAALHQEKCTGEYITPPICDESAQRQAEFILTVDCEDYDTVFADADKADGAFCDWFGVGCNPDEVIFTGPSCEVDADCSNDSFCVENHCFQGVLSEEFSGVLDSFTDSEEVSGSFLYLLADNDETRHLRRGMMESAEHSIHFSALLIENNESGYETVNLLVEAAARGVEVRVLVDATTHYFQSDYSMLRELSEGGVKTIAFNPINEWGSLRFIPEYWGLTANMRLHEKILIIDGSEAVTGGRNVGDSYFDSERWRDIDVYIRGPGVRDIQSMFLFMWNRAVNWERVASCRSERRYGNWCPPEDKEPVEGPEYFPDGQRYADALTRAIHSDPYSQDTAYGYFTTLALVRGARSSIYISNAYFIPPRRLRNHLRAAAERGVDVRVVTNSRTSTDFETIYFAGLNFYKELIGSGVKIYEYKGEELLHSKVMLVDGEMALAGSYNLDPRSAIDNSEILLLYRNSSAVSALQEAIEEDIANSTLADDNISTADMIRARAARIAEPLL